MATGKGGQRPNAGRKPIDPNEKKIKVQLFVKPATKAAIDRVGKPAVIGIIERNLPTETDTNNEQHTQPRTRA